MIVRAPSEWHYSDDKYKSLKEKIGNLDPDEVKKLIKSLAFWDDCKAMGVFDEQSGASPFPANAKDGKEIWGFHPVSFVQQMSALQKAGLSPVRKTDFDYFTGLIRAAAGEQYTDADSCKAIAVSFCYRLRKHEWSEASNFHSLAERYRLPVIPPTMKNSL
jgi:hypothetical protein